jgi:hypothetical protein
VGTWMIRANSVSGMASMARYIRIDEPIVPVSQ